MSDDIREIAEAVLGGSASRGNPYAGKLGRAAWDLANHVLTTEARLDVALRGAMQSREEMREWLGSDQAWDAASDAVAVAAAARCISVREAAVIRTTITALIAAMPGSDA